MDFDAIYVTNVSYEIPNYFIFVECYPALGRRREFDRVRLFSCEADQIKCSNFPIIVV
jgi:hypothetical protein